MTRRQIAADRAAFTNCVRAVGQSYIGPQQPGATARSIAQLRERALYVRVRTTSAMIRVCFLDDVKRIFCDRTNLPPQAPNVPRQPSKAHHNFVPCNIDLEKAGADIIHCEPGIVKVVERKWHADWLLGAVLQALGPKAKLTVAVGDKIDHIAIGRPSRLVVPTIGVINRNPIPLLGRSVTLQRHDEKPAACRFRMTVDGENLA